MNGNSMSPDIKQSRLCAYCGCSGQLTREHIIPKFIFKRQYEKSSERLLTNIITRSGPAATPSEPTIADVCSQCNGGFLSALDQYASGLYDRYFDHSCEVGKEIRFEFDFVRLSRWLMKLSFNVGRARNWSTDLMEELQHFVPYVRGIPTVHPEFWMLLRVLSPVSSIELEKLSNLKQLSVEDIESIRRPDFRRVGHWASEHVQGVVIGMNAFQFWICFPKQLPSAEWNKTRGQLLRSAPANTWLRSDKPRAIIYPSKWSMIDELTRSLPLQRNVQIGAKMAANRGASSVR